MSRCFWLNTVAVLLVVTAGAAQAEEKAEGTTVPETAAVQVEIQRNHKAPPGPPDGKPRSVVKPITGVDRSYMDLTVSPCKDFYAYANGAFEKVPIPGQYPAYGVNQEIDERNFAILKEILETSARTGGPKAQRGPARRRLLRVRHGRGRDRARGIAAACAVLEPHSGDHEPQDAGRGHRPVTSPGSERRFPVRSADRRQGQHEHDREL